MEALLYSSGDLFLPDNIINLLNTYIVGDAVSSYYINLWSILHLVVGLLFRFVSHDVNIAFMTHFIWELWQVVIGMTKLNLRGVVDIINDFALFIVGFYIGEKMGL